MYNINQLPEALVSRVCPESGVTVLTVICENMKPKYKPINSQKYAKPLASVLFTRDPRSSSTT